MTESPKRTRPPRSAREREQSRLNKRCEPGVLARCRKCGAEGFSPDTFYPSDKYQCRACNQAASKARYPQVAAHERKRRFARKYGLTEEDLSRMSEAQSGRCAVCGIDPKLATKRDRYRCLYVDHDHATGKVRALLCNSCNLAIGHIKDNAALARALASYLEAHA